MISYKIVISKYILNYNYYNFKKGPVGKYI